MQYTVVRFRLPACDPWRDLLIYALGNEGPYDSFEETSDGLNAYVPSSQYKESFVRETLCGLGIADTPFVAEPLPDRDWNEEWERQHQPVLVENFCYVRAPFHAPVDGVQYDLVIEPKMSFGTAHHATTYMMLTYIRDVEMRGKRVLDMGCGTAVLAILAAKRGAAAVDAVDIDEWAFSNAKENVCSNGVEDVVRCNIGDASLLGAHRYDVIFANINRNILMHDMPAYASVLENGGTLLLSGFYEHDIEALQGAAAPLGLRLQERRVRDGWAALRLEKIEG